MAALHEQETALRTRKGNQRGSMGPGLCQVDPGRHPQELDSSKKKVPDSLATRTTEDLRSAAIVALFERE